VAHAGNGDVARPLEAARVLRRDQVVVHRVDRGRGDTRAPCCFGLAQRDRNFEHYLDGVGYEKRPTVWVEPLGDCPTPGCDGQIMENSKAYGCTSWKSRSEPGQNSTPLIQSRLPPTRLLSTKDEAYSIMQFAPAGLSVVLTGFAATRDSALADNLENYRILHFATHSLVNNRYPALTGLWLSTINAQGQRQNGFLQLHDIYGLRLNADLVVLSGCQTGLGEELSGEGLVGLTQGFLYAGSKSVVVSLWSVQDKTTEALMTNFYEAMLKEGMAPADALRHAKLKIYQQSQWRSPYYWSAFVIQGEFRRPPTTWKDLLPSRSLWTISALLAITSWMLWSQWKVRRRKRKEAMTRSQYGSTTESHE